MRHEKIDAQAEARRLGQTLTEQLERRQFWDTGEFDWTPEERADWERWTLSGEPMSIQRLRELLDKPICVEYDGDGSFVRVAPVSEWESQDDEG